MEVKKHKIDGNKVDKILYEKGLSRAEASREMGFGSSYISNIIQRGGNVNGAGFKLMKMVLGVEEDDNILVVKPKAIVKEINKDEEICDANEMIVRKLDELITAVNRLGSIEMQNMNYLRVISDASVEINKNLIV